MRALKGHFLRTRAFGELWPSASQEQVWSQSLVGDRVTGTPQLGATLQKWDPGHLGGHSSPSQWQGEGQGGG